MNKQYVGQNFARLISDIQRQNQIKPFDISGINTVYNAWEEARQQEELQRLREERQALAQQTASEKEARLQQKEASNLLAQQQREAEKQRRAAEREAEQQQREAQREAEQQQRTEQRIAEQRQRAAEQQRREAERQALFQEKLAQAQARTSGALLDNQRKELALWQQQTKGKNRKGTGSVQIGLGGEGNSLSKDDISLTTLTVPQISLSPLTGLGFQQPTGAFSAPTGVGEQSSSLLPFKSTTLKIQAVPSAIESDLSASAQAGQDQSLLTQQDEVSLNKSSWPTDKLPQTTSSLSGLSSNLSSVSDLSFNLGTTSGLNSGLTGGQTGLSSSLRADLSGGLTGGEAALNSNLSGGLSGGLGSDLSFGSNAPLDSVENGLNSGLSVVGGGLNGTTTSPLAGGLGSASRTQLSSQTPNGSVSGVFDTSASSLATGSSLADNTISDSAKDILKQRVQTLLSAGLPLSADTQAGMNGSGLFGSVLGDKGTSLALNGEASVPNTSSKLWNFL